MSPTLSKIGRPVDLPSESSGTFDDVHRDILWTRVTKTMSLFAVISLLYTVVIIYVLKMKPVVNLDLTSVCTTVFWAHSATFILALVILYVLRDRACAVFQQTLAFVVFLLNIFIAFFSQLPYNPGQMDLFTLSVLVIVPAAFIPWKTRVQAGLALGALLSFLGFELWTHAKVPEIHAYWDTHMGRQDFQTHMIIDTMSVVILGLISISISRTLYSLSRTSHQIQRLGNYIVMEKIGAGGMGRVLKARHHLICRPAAVKVLDVPAGAEGLAALKRFEREVMLSARLSHPNTIQIYDFGRAQDDMFYYAMEYLQGLDLEQLVRKHGPVAPERAVFILRQICSSLTEAHEMGVVHRDIKPSNIYLAQLGGLRDFVKVLDFGLAKQLENTGDASLSKTGMVFGTPRYIAPEALYGQERMDARSDLYNLGGVAYWLVTARPPFDTTSSVDLIVDHVKNTPPPPGEISELPIPPELEAIIMRLLAKEPDDRFQTAAELGEALAALDIASDWGWQKAHQWWDLHGLTARPEDACFDRSKTDAASVTQIDMKPLVP